MTQEEVMRTFMGRENVGYIMGRFWGVHALDIINHALPEILYKNYLDNNYKTEIGVKPDLARSKVFLKKCFFNCH